jgi:hypothetical protein
MKPNTPIRRGRITLCAAVIGGSAVVAIGALGVAIHEERAVGGVATGTYMQGGGMTLGATATTTTPPTAPVTSFAVPAVKAKEFGGS